MADVHPVLPGCADEELWLLCSAMCDGTIDRQGLARLEDMVQSDPAKQLFVAAYMRMNGGLMRVFRPRVSDGGSPPFDVAATAGSASVEAAAVGAADEFVGAAVELPHQLVELPQQLVPTSPLILSPLPPSLSTTHYPLPTPFVGGPLFSYIAATLILGVMLLGAWAYTITHDYVASLAQNSRGSTTPGESTQQRPDPIFIARVTGMKDCRWADPSTETYAGAFVPLGRKYVLSSGLMEITYRSGAKVILEGPCRYEVESAAGGFLALGKLTARVESEKPRPKPQVLRPKTEISKSLNPRIPSSFIPHPSSFVVRTPTAVVTDLGTEFGVAVAENGDTTSHVFRGMVRVQTVDENLPSPFGRGGEGRAIQLNAGETARVEKEKDGESLNLIAGGEAGNPPKFVRKLNDLVQKLDPARRVDGRVFSDDFDGNAIDSAKWDAVDEDQRSIVGGIISVADGCALLCTHDKKDSDELEKGSRLLSDTPGKRKVAYLLSKPGRLDFSGSTDDWWVEIRFQITGNLDSPNWSPEWRTWAILSGEIDDYFLSAFDLRAIQRGSVDSEEFDLGWFGNDNSGDINGSPPGRGKRTAERLCTGLIKGQFYTITLHRNSDAMIDVYLDGEPIATRPMIGGVNPEYLRTGDMMPWNICGTCRVDYIKVGSLKTTGTTSNEETRKEDRPMDR